MPRERTIGVAFTIAENMHGYHARRLSVRGPRGSAFSSRAIWENAPDLSKLRHIGLTPRLGGPQHVCTERRNEKMISSCGAPSCSNSLSLSLSGHVAKRGSADSALLFFFKFYFVFFTATNSRRFSIDVFIVYFQSASDIFNACMTQGRDGMGLTNCRAKHL